METDPRYVIRNLMEKVSLVNIIPRRGGRLPSNDDFSTILTKCDDVTLLYYIQLFLEVGGGEFSSDHVELYCFNCLL